MSASAAKIQPVSARGDACRRSIADAITRYLKVKRALGCRFNTEGRSLRLFDRFLLEQGIRRADQITSECVDRFLASRPRLEPRSFNELLGCVRRLFEWLVNQDELDVSPVRTPPRRATGRRLPYLFEPEILRELLRRAERLPDESRCPQRGPTQSMIFALLATLGLRIGEVSRLTCGDVDFDHETLLIRNSKFGKSRVVPIGPRLVARLQAYLVLREQRLGAASPDAPLFSWQGREPVHPNSIRRTFRDHLLPHLALTIPPGTSRPCVHGLRHSFAVRSLLRWYREGLDPTARLNHLSTFLGHVNPNSTAVYLTITNELLEAANVRFEAYATPLSGEGQP
ncbi:MAG: tyrosine-type recombinase/integrase [Solirubrobacteraceae bacterium]